MNHKKRKQLFIILCISTLFDVGILLGRMMKAGAFPEEWTFASLVNSRGSTFLFLIWNLFLAWIPYWIALSLQPLYNRYPSKIWSGLLLFLWLLFLPNAPYIVTDLLHLRPRPPVPLWYDLLLLFSFAWTGLILGFLSILEVQQFLKNKVGERKAQLLPFLIIPLISLGIYIGRFQRWNSWDIFFHPFDLLQDILEMCIHPFSHLSAIGLIIVLTGLLLISYRLFFILTENLRK